MSSFYSTFTMWNRNLQNPRLQKVALYFVCLTSCFISYGYCIYLYAYFYIYAHTYTYTCICWLQRKKILLTANVLGLPLTHPIIIKCIAPCIWKGKEPYPLTPLLSLYYRCFATFELWFLSLLLLGFGFFSLLSYAENNEEALWFSAQSFYLCISIVVILFPSVIP